MRPAWECYAAKLVYHIDEKEPHLVLSFFEISKTGYPGPASSSSLFMRSLRAEQGKAPDWGGERGAGAHFGAELVHAGRAPEYLGS